MKYILIVLGVALVTAGFIYKDELKTGVLGAEIKNEKKKKDKNNKAPASPQVEVKNTWNLPERLKEVSGIAYLDTDRFACVQDEEGVIFIYNTATSKVEKEIPFGPAGDYEGITLAGANAYIIRSDGTLFEIADWNTKAVTKQYPTGLSVKHNVEGLTYDKAANRLLLAIKDDEPTTKEYKGIYAFDLAKRSAVSGAVYKISMTGTTEGEEKKKKKGFKPSAIARHPATGELYIVDGPASRLMIMKEDGTVKGIYALGETFEQPEGITFSPSGEMYLSSEGVTRAGSIMHVGLK